LYSPDEHRVGIALGCHLSTTFTAESELLSPPPKNKNPTCYTILGTIHQPTPYNVTQKVTTYHPSSVT